MYPSNPSPLHLICYTCVHCLHLSIAAAITFARIVSVLSSNSESVLKIGLVFAYELEFRRSIYQNQLEKKFGSARPPRFVGFKKFYFGKKLVTRSSFRGHRFLLILSTSSEFSTGHAFHLFKLISALFLIIFLLF